MDSKTTVHRRGLQQQPQRPVNRQQQQSSGSGEFQATRALQAGEEIVRVHQENNAPG